MLEELKRKLAAEGLFDVERKKPLPLFPSRMAVVTSPTGAAVRDILRILRRRNAGIDVVIMPTPVQGEGADERIARAIAVANRHALGEVIIVGRGGGSLEDLLPFLLGDRRARHSRIRAPGHLRRRPRNRRHPVRPRRRCPRADPFGRGRDGRRLRVPSCWRASEARAPTWNGRSASAWRGSASCWTSSRRRTSSGMSACSCSPWHSGRIMHARSSSRACGRAHSQDCAPAGACLPGARLVLAPCHPGQGIRRGHARTDRSGPASAQGVERGDMLSIRLARAACRATAEEAHAVEKQ